MAKGGRACSAAKVSLLHSTHTHTHIQKCFHGSNADGTIYLESVIEKKRCCTFCVHLSLFLFFLLLSFFIS